jgi:hypothetical protein
MRWFSRPGQRRVGAHRRRSRILLAASVALAVVVIIGVVLTLQRAGRVPPATGAGAHPSVGASPTGSSAPATKAPRATPGSAGFGAAATPEAPEPRAESSPAAQGSRQPGGFPGPASTGVTSEVDLRPSGGVDITDDGAVVENLLVTDGSIEVYADNVTIRNVRITNSSEALYWGILQREGYSGLVVEDSEIIGGSAAPMAAGITNHGGMLTVRRVEVRGVSDAVNTETGLVEHTYLHDPRYTDGDHNDMVQANGGPVAGERLVIRYNTIINSQSQTGAISLFGNFSPVRDVLIEGNYLAGGGYTLYGGGLVEEGSTPANIVIRDNVFGRDVFPKGGFYGPVAHFDRSAPGNVWSGNRWDDGSPVNP